MSNTYLGGWVFGDHASITLAALKFDDLYQRWEGNLHFPDGTCRIYLEVNPKAGLAQNTPTLFIRTVQGDVFVGVLMRVAKGKRERFYGRINTATALSIEGYVIPTGTRLVLYARRHRNKPLSPTKPNSVIRLDLLPYPQGQSWSANYHNIQVRKRKAQAAKQGENNAVQ